MDKYIRSLPCETKKITSQQNLASQDELVSPVDSQRVTIKTIAINTSGTGNLVKKCPRLGGHMNWRVQDGGNLLQVMSGCAFSVESQATYPGTVLGRINRCPRRILRRKTMLRARLLLGSGNLSSPYDPGQNRWDRYTSTGRPWQCGVPRPTPSSGTIRVWQNGAGVLRPLITRFWLPGKDPTR